MFCLFKGNPCGSLICFNVTTSYLDKSDLQYDPWARGWEASLATGKELCVLGAKKTKYTVKITVCQSNLWGQPKGQWLPKDNALEFPGGNLKAFCKLGVLGFHVFRFELSCFLFSGFLQMDKNNTYFIGRVNFHWFLLRNKTVVLGRVEKQIIGSADHWVSTQWPSRTTGTSPFLVELGYISIKLLPESPGQGQKPKHCNWSVKVRKQRIVSALGSPSQFLPLQVRHSWEGIWFSAFLLR